MHFATKIGSLFDGTLGDIRKRGLFYSLFTLFTSDIYVCWKNVFCCIIGYNNV